MPFCEMCGHKTEKHPNLCEAHRPPREHKDIIQFGRAAIELDKWKPLLMEDVKLVTHILECKFMKEAVEIYLLGKLCGDRKIRGIPKDTCVKLFKKGTLIDFNSDRKVKMDTLQMIVNSCNYDSGRPAATKFQYDVRIDIGSWFMSVE